MVCNRLANGAIPQYLSNSAPISRKLQLLPLEKAVVFLGTKKIKTDVGPEVRFQNGREEAMRFYTLPVVIVGVINKGGLGWSRRRCEQISSPSLDLVLRSKLDMYQIWLSEQCIRICATRRNLAHIQDILDDKCPNCGQAQETSTHLNRCPNNSPTCLFNESVTHLSTWMHQLGCTDLELAYWTKKYLLFCGTRLFTSLVDERGLGSGKLHTVAASQDLIG